MLGLYAGDRYGDCDYNQANKQEGQPTLNLRDIRCEAPACCEVATNGSLEATAS